LTWVLGVAWAPTKAPTDEDGSTRPDEPCGPPGSDSNRPVLDPAAAVAFTEGSSESGFAARILADVQYRARAC
jgi:hypothetical protein